MKNSINGLETRAFAGRGDGRVYQGVAIALVLCLAPLGCTEEVIVVEPASDDAGNPTADAQQSADAGVADTKASPKADSATEPDTSAPRDTGAEQLCVDTINKYRATLNLPALQRWSANESCAASQGLADSKSGVPHSAFGKCGEWAQNECPGWPGPGETMITGCLQMMWNEGPGQDFSKHGHYINMSSSQYTMVACGFATAADGSIWGVQDFK